MSTFELLAGGTSLSAGSADLAMTLAMGAADASVSAGSADLTLITDALVTSLGLQADGGASLAEVTQTGIQADVGGAVEVHVTVTGVQVDARLDNDDAHVTQSGIQADASGDIAEVTFAGVQADAVAIRTEGTTNCWEFHAYDRFDQYLAHLDNIIESSYQSELNEVGGGRFQIHQDDDKATAANLANGNTIKVRYRNVHVGAFEVEDTDEELVSQNEKAGELWTIGGRGLFGSLDKVLIYQSDLEDASTAQRDFEDVTLAFMFIDLYREAEARGGGDLTISFSATDDTNDVTWTDSSAKTFSAGQSLLDVAKHMSALGIDITVTAEGRRLNFYQHAGMDRTGTVIFRKGKHILKCTRRKRSRELANAILAMGQDIVVEDTDATSIASFGRKERLLSARNTDNSAQVATEAAILLEKLKDPIESVSIQVTTDPFYPFIDYDIGDTVHVSIPGKIDTDYRIMAISVEERTGPCDLMATLDLNSVWLDYILRVQKAFEANQRIGVSQATDASLTSDAPFGASTGDHDHTESDVTDLVHDAEKIRTRNVSTNVPDDADVLAFGTTDLSWTPTAHSARPGAASAMLKSDDNGYLQLERLGAGVAPQEALSANGNLNLPKASGFGVKVDLTTPTFGWRDLRAEIRTRGVGASDPNDSTYIGNVKAYAFSVGDEAWIEFHIPHDYVPGTDIHLHFHWSHNSAVVTGGNIILGADVTYAKGHNQAVFAATVNPTLVATAIASASNGQYRQMIDEVQLSANSPSGTQIDTDDLEPDGLVLARVYLAANNITSSGAVPDPFIHEVDIHYQSTSISTKDKVPDFYA